MGNYSKEDITKDSFEIRLHKTLSILFFIGGGFFGILVVLMATVGNNETATWYIYLGFGGGALVSFITGMIIIRCKVGVQGETIKVHPLIGSPKAYSFSQITHAVYHPNPNRLENMVSVYIGKKKLFVFSELYIGYEYMYQRLEAANLITDREK